MLHPIDHFYCYLGGLVNDAIDQDLTGDVDQYAPCSDCGRLPSEWVVPFGENKAVEPGTFTPKAFRGKDAYGTRVQRCPSCHSLYVGSVERLGVEGMRSGHPVPAKLGMMPQTGVFIELDTGNVELVGPPKTNAKISDQFPHTLTDATGIRKMARLIMEPERRYPALVIADMGRKKEPLIQNLRVSQSEHDILACDAEGIVTYSRPAIQTCLDALAGEKKQANLWARLMSDYAKGRRPRYDDKIRELWRDNGRLKQATASLPADPHDFLANVQLTKHIMASQ